MVRRGLTTGVPAVAAVLLAAPLGAAPSTVALASIILTQLAQTVQAGYSQEQLIPPVLGALAASGGILVLALTLPPLDPNPWRRIDGLGYPHRANRSALRQLTSPCAGEPPMSGRTMPGGSDGTGLRTHRTRQ